MLICVLVGTCALLSPSSHSLAVSNALSAYACTVLPGLLPFLFLSSLISALGLTFGAIPCKVVRFLFGTHDGDLTVMSIIAGYPMSAKLLGEQNAQIPVPRRVARAITAHSSLPGPMFVIGAVGAGMLQNAYMGGVLYAVQLCAALITGLIFRCRTATLPLPPMHRTSATLNDCVQNTLSSALTIGLFIALSAVILATANALCLPDLLALIGIDKSLTSTAIACIVEMSNGAMHLAANATPLAIAALSFTLAFGGLAVMAQSISLARGAIKPLDYFAVKLTQGAIAFCLTLPIIL